MERIERLVRLHNDLVPALEIVRSIHHEVQGHPCPYAPLTDVAADGVLRVMEFLTEEMRNVTV